MLGRLLTVSVIFLAPGGNVVTEGEDDKVVKTSVCVFTSKPDIESLKSFYEVGLISGQDASLCMALWGHRKSCTVRYPGSDPWC